MVFPAVSKFPTVSTNCFFLLIACKLLKSNDETSPLMTLRATSTISLNILSPREDVAEERHALFKFANMFMAGTQLIFHTVCFPGVREPIKSKDNYHKDDHVLAFDMLSLPHRWSRSQHGKKVYILSLTGRFKVLQIQVQCCCHLFCFK